MQKNFTKGSVLKALMAFSMPYLLSCFLQTFYGMADLYVTGQYNKAAAISAVSIGSQVMHMLAVVVVGLAMGTTVLLGQAVGEKNQEKAGKIVGNTVVLFLAVSVVFTGLLLLGTDQIMEWVAVPKEALAQTKSYLTICFCGIPFITAYNILSCIFRGMGDSKSPMYFVAAACVLNILLDFLFIGGFQMAATGAALGTVLSQTASVIMAFAVIRKKKEFALHLTGRDLRPERETLGKILKIGVPVACQDGFIQISFILITVIANQRGVVAAAGVGIVEKVISFLFLVPSAMLSSISAIAAQNVGAGKHERAEKTLGYGLLISVSFGIVAALACNLAPEMTLGLFSKEKDIIFMGSQYLKAYALDCAIAGVHFCFSGYFCAYGKSTVSFLHNLISMAAVRVPGAYLAAVYFPDTLYPMGLAAPAGSLLSSVICMAVFLYFRKRRIRQSL